MSFERVDDLTVVIKQKVGSLFWRDRRKLEDRNHEAICFFSSRRRHTSSYGDWSSDVCSSDLALVLTGKPFVFCAGADVKEFPLATTREIGRAACRERVEISGVAVSLKKKKIYIVSCESAVRWDSVWRGWILLGMVV